MGIGSAIAEALAAKGANLILFARSEVRTLPLSPGYRLTPSRISYRTLQTKSRSTMQLK